MYLFRVSGPKPYGLDDELLIMKCENKIKAFKRLFPGDGVYVWKNDRTDGFIQFRLVSIKSNNLMDDDILTIYVELLDYKYQSVRKKLINQSVIHQFKHYINDRLKFDLAICSITKVEIKITNESKFILPEKPKKYQPEFKIYTGGKGFETIRESSYLFSDDVDDSIMSYKMSLMSRNR